MKKRGKKVPPEKDEEILPLGPLTDTPPETEEENPDQADPGLVDVGNPPPTKPSPIKK